MDSSQRRSRVITIGLPVLGFLLPAVIVYVILRHQWPTHHDLSDIGTGMARFIFSVSAGVLGALITHIALRLTRR